MRAQSRQQQIADEIRAQIINGDLDPGSRLGTTAELQEKHGVSEIVIRGVIQMLGREGLVTSHRGPGHGHCVAERSLIRLVTDERYRAMMAGETPGMPAATTLYRARRIKASTAIRRRLELAAGAVVVAVDFEFRDTAGDVTHVANTYEPVDIVGGTPAELTGSGTVSPGTDVFSRMTSIGVLGVTDEAVEETQARAVTHDEAEQLGIPPGAAIMHTIATFRDSAGRPVSTTDFLLPGYRFVRVDRIRLGGAGG
jgi:GntR family transcriptional regulator